MRRTKSNRAFRGIFCLVLCLLLAFGPLIAGSEDTTVPADPPAAGDETGKPAGGASGDTKTGDSTSGSSKPADSTPGDTKPGDKTPSGTTPGDTKPDSSTPSDTTPSDTKPSDNTPSDTTPGGTKPGDNTPSDTTPGGTKPSDNTPSDNTPSDNTPGSNTPSDNTPGSNTPSDNTPGSNTPGDNTPGDNTPGGNTPGDNTPGDNTPEGSTPNGNTNPDEKPRGETPSGETPSGEIPSGENPSGENGSGDEGSPSPSPTPTVQPPRLVIVVDGAKEDEKNHVWRLTLTAGSPLNIRWATDSKADGYQLVFSGNGVTERREGNVVTAEIDTTDFESGTYTVRVSASLRGTVRATTELTLVLTIRRPGATDDTQPTPTATGPKPTGDTQPTPTATATDNPEPSEEVTPTDKSPTPGKVSPTPRKPNFPRKRRSGQGGKEDVFVITPGKALISTHAKGTGDMTAYGTVPLTLDEESMTILSMGGQALEVSRGGDAAFTASLEDTRLTLTAEEGDAWYFTQYALQVLARSGITEISLNAPDGETEISTDMTLTGAAYGRERAGGFVASDFLYAYASDLLTVQVEDRLYAVNNGIMIAINDEPAE